MPRKRARSESVDVVGTLESITHDLALGGKEGVGKLLCPFCEVEATAFGPGPWCKCGGPVGLGPWLLEYDGGGGPRCRIVDAGVAPKNDGGEINGGRGPPKALVSIDEKEDSAK